MKQLTYSEKVLSAMKKRKIKKARIYNALGCTAPTLDTRLELNNWRMSEVEILNNLLNIK